MNMNYIEIIGFTAAILTTVSFVPQMIKVIQTRSTGDISLGMFACLTTGIFMWLIYGIFIISIPIIAANLLSFMFNIVILFYKLKYK